MEDVQKKLTPEKSRASFFPIVTAALTPSDVQEKKQVSFHRSVAVILIAGKDEYIKAKIHNNIWYNTDEFNRFKQEENERRLEQEQEQEQETEAMKIVLK